MPDTVEFFGERYEIGDKIGLMPLMRFAKVAKAGADSADMEAMVVMYDLLEQCLAPHEWQRFQDAADRNRADGDELFKVVTDVIATLSARPTSRPSGSSDGPPSTPTSSTDGSSFRVIERLQNQGRPDLALMVLQTDEARSAA